MNIQEFILHDKNHIDVKITESDCEIVKDFVKKMVIAKPNEKNHLKDLGSIETREFTGKIGELALERHLEIPFLDLTVGKSDKYNVPDLQSAGFNLGIKTVTTRNTAVLVFKNPKIAEVLCVWDAENMVVHILGIAPPNVLKTYSDINLVLSKSVIEYGQKTAFDRYDKLLPPNKFWFSQFKKKPET